jgi:hypothetical protein
MASRSVRRRHHQRSARAHTRAARRRATEAARLLPLRQRRPAQRARLLSVPAVWQAPNDPHLLTLIPLLDNSSALLQGLQRACAEALAAMFGPPPSQGRPAHG